MSGRTIASRRWCPARISRSPRTAAVERSRGVAVVLVLALSWIALALLSRGRLADRQQLLTQLFAGLVIATYVGAWLGAIGATRHPRRMLLRALATTSVVLASLAILELAAAFRWVHWMLIFRALSGEGVDYRTAYVLDEALSFRRIPGLQWSGRPASDIEATYGLPATVTRPITFNYDQWGYRNAVTMATADIVLLGDSYVEGWYVSDDETVAAHLAERLKRPVANLAVAGYGTLQELQVLKTDALRRHPKVVAWFFFEGNDLYDDQKFENTLLAEPPSREDTTPTRAGLTRNHGWAERSFVLNAFKWIRRSAHPLVPNQVPYWARLKGSGTEAPRLYFFGYGGVPWTTYEEDRWAIARAAFDEGVAFCPRPRHPSRARLRADEIPRVPRLHRHPAGESDGWMECVASAARVFPGALPREPVCRAWISPSGFRHRFGQATCHTH